MKKVSFFSVNSGRGIDSTTSMLSGYQQNLNTGGCLRSRLQNQNYVVNFLITVLLYIFCVCFLVSCRISSPEDDILIIPVDVRENAHVRLSEISIDIKRIVLETSEESVIGGLRQALLDNDRIFVLDIQGIHAFDLSGKYLFSINKRGRGPGEFLIPSNITMDAENIYFSGGSGKILRYDRDGRFIDERTDMGFLEYLRFENDFLHVIRQEFTRPMGNETFANIAIMDRYSRNWQLVDTIVVKTIIVPGLVASTGPGVDYISKDDRGNLFVYYPVHLLETFARDTLYVLDNDRLLPHAKLKFNNENSTQRNKRINSITRTSRFLFTNYFCLQDNEKKYFFYDFKNKTGKNMTGGFLDDVYNSGIVEIRLIDNQYFYFVTEAEYSPDIAMEPNPVLYIGKFKE